MNVFELEATFGLNDKPFVDGMKDTESKASAFGESISKAFSTSLKVIGAGLATGAGAVSMLVKNAAGAFADYEQLVGGVETLFKNNADMVQAYANEAYKTAGLSANEYMETVTSFSASLLQSLDGDTAKSAEVANKAIIDMSDNANKMGTSMESIQNAYQGFAKQNYTMLDNLKLGYGGTKEEMARLLADATELSGIEYDLDSYADIVEAIHVVQDNLGITGTTAKEASTTISGSISSMKSAWTNLIAGLGNEDADLGALMDQFVESAETALGNLIPVVERALDGVGNLITGMAPVLIAKLPELVRTLLPKLIESTKTLVGSLAKALPEIFKAIRDILPEILTTIFNELGMDVDVDGFFELFDTVIGGIVDIFEGLGDILAPVVDFLVDTFNVIVDVFNKISENETAVAVLEGVAIAIGVVVGVIEAWSIAQGVLNAVMMANPITLIVVGIGALIGAIVLLITYWDDVKKAMQAVWDTIVEIFSNIGGWFKDKFDSAVKAVKDVWDGIGEFFSGVWEFISAPFVQAGIWFSGVFSKVVRAIKKAWDGIGDFFIGLWEDIKAIFAKAWEIFYDIGKNIVQGLWDGVKALWGGFVGFFTSSFHGLAGIAQQALDEHSPSKVFKQIGKYVVEGFQIGFDDEFDDMEKDFNARFTSLTEPIETNGNFEISASASTSESMAEALREALDGYEIKWDDRNLGRLVKQYA